MCGFAASAEDPVAIEEEADRDRDRPGHHFCDPDPVEREVEDLRQADEEDEVDRRVDRPDDHEPAGPESSNPGVPMDVQPYAPAEALRCRFDRLKHVAPCGRRALHHGAPCRSLLRQLTIRSQCEGISPISIRKPSAGRVVTITLALEAQIVHCDRNLLTPTCWAGCHPCEGLRQ
jgi:hypothetical protein